MKHTAHTRKGFTLIEILVAASIIAVLSVVGVTSYTSINKRSRDARRKSDLEQIRSALEMYRVDNGHYPCNSTGWVSHDYTTNPEAGVYKVLEPDYMTTVPKDPKVVSGDHVANPTNPPGGYFAYMYASSACSSPIPAYALWTQLESPSSADIASEGQGTINTYNNGHGMNYKVINP
ncbi:MAG: prepilin-type N-terminal cleavage/methylation domain-containing protein [Candidatus Gottesmanbacteria bacterium]|nr:prepilin-type N-terminal cleavage/methylation domain-containing protein [Candidatus Gottesmanbacteria bacterium]